MLFDLRDYGVLGFGIWDSDTYSAVKKKEALNLMRLKLLKVSSSAAPKRLKQQNWYAH